MPADNEQNHNSVQQYQWSGLKQMLTNLARFSVPVLPIPIIVTIVLIFVIFSGGATGWCAALIFRHGMVANSQSWWIATISGYAFGLGLAGFIFIDVVYTAMSNIKLSGEDYDSKDRDSKYKRLGISLFRLLGRTTTIVSCAMFTYGQVSSADTAEINTQATKAARIEAHRATMRHSDSTYTATVNYLQYCDHDNDRANDDWAKTELSKTIDSRRIEKAKEDSILQMLLTLPDKPDETVLASVSAVDGTRLLKDIGSEKRPTDWTFRILLIILSAIIGFCPEGVIARGGDMVGKYLAFRNVKKVHDDVQKLMKQNEEITETYDKKPSKFSLFRREFSSVNGGHSSPANGGGGEGFDWNSERIREMLDYIKKNWRGYGGTKTQEQIGAEFQCGKSYISQLITAAKDKKLLIDPGSIRNGR